MENLYLAHHGVKGMKWGVRRTPAQLGHDVPAGGGGGGVELDEEELKKLKERLEAMASENFSSDDISKLASGARLQKDNSWANSDGTTGMRRQVYYRDGNELKYSFQQGIVDKKGNFKVTNSGNAITLDDVDGAKPFQNIKVKTSAAGATRSAIARAENALGILAGKGDREKAERRLQQDLYGKEKQERNVNRLKRRAQYDGADDPEYQKKAQERHRKEVDDRIAEARKKNNRAFRYSSETQRQQAEQLRKKQEAKEKANAKSTKDTKQREKQEQHRRDVDRRIAEANRDKKVRQRDHRAEVDRKIENAKRERQRKHQEEVDRRIAEGKATQERQKKHREDVDKRLRDAKREEEKLERLRIDQELRKRKRLRSEPRRNA